MLLVRRTLDERLALLVGEIPAPRRLLRRRGLPPTRAQTIRIVERARELEQARAAVFGDVGAAVRADMNQILEA